MKLLTSLLATTMIAAASFAPVAHADEYVDYAKKVVAEATAPVTKWDGPTTGPSLQHGKKIIFIASDMKNGGVLGVLDGLKEALGSTDWQLDVLDGAGSVNNQLASLNQAIAKKPDAIVIGGWNPNVARGPLRKAVQNNIKLVAWHATPQPGPIDKFNIFTNVTSDSDKIAELSALLAVAKSDGKAKALILTDSLYEIALRKAEVMRDVIKKCKECEVLEFADTPLADTSSRVPGLTFSSKQKYGDNWTYTLAINDLYFDFMAPSLRTAKVAGDGAPYNISAGDGSVTAYQRIRDAQYQFATVPEPLNLHGWQLVDELNRAFAGQAPSGYITPVHLVTKENIHFDGGDKNLYDPQNGYKDAYKHIWQAK